MKKLLIFALLLPTISFAGGGYGGHPKQPPKTVNTTHTTTQVQGQHQGQTQHAESTASNNVDIGNASAANLEVNHQASAPDVVLVPQGHTSNCQRTYGISFSNTGGGGGLGWPYRDKQCDYDNEAADAFAAGQHAIGWYWNCHKKSAYKVFKKNGHTTDEAIQLCHQRMMRMYVKIDDQPPERPSEPVTVNCEVGQHDTTHKRIFESCQAK